MQFKTYNGDRVQNRKLAEQFETLGYSYAKRRDNVMWRRRSLEIATRDQDQCRRCDHRNLHLQTHHCYYRSYPDGLPACPWDYPTASLITLCDACHAYEEKFVKPSKAGLYDKIRARGGTNEDFCLLVNAIRQIPQEFSIKDIVGVFWVALSLPEQLARLATKYLTHKDQIQLVASDWDRLADVLSERGASSRDFALFISAIQKQDASLSMQDIAGVIWTALSFKSEFTGLLPLYVGVKRT